LLLPTWHLLASVEEEYNAVYLRCAASGDLSLFGKGAGALPTATAVLGDLIDLAQHNSVRWPVPQHLPLADPTAPGLARRHYLRVSGEAHPGLARRVESLVRRAGLRVQNRAVRAEAAHVHLGFMISTGPDTAIAQVQEAVAKLAWVTTCLALGVFE
jgi:homoserine dehydrogenase